MPDNSPSRTGESDLNNQSTHKQGRFTGELRGGMLFTPRASGNDVVLKIKDVVNDRVNYTCHKASDLSQPSTWHGNTTGSISREDFINEVVQYSGGQSGVGQKEHKVA